MYFFPSFPRIFCRIPIYSYFVTPFKEVHSPDTLYPGISAKSRVNFTQRLSRTFSFVLQQQTVISRCTTPTHATQYLVQQRGPVNCDNSPQRVENASHNETLCPIANRLSTTPAVWFFLQHSPLPTASFHTVLHFPRRRSTHSTSTHSTLPFPQSTSTHDPPLPTARALSSAVNCKSSAIFPAVDGWTNWPSSNSAFKGGNPSVLTGDYRP